MVDDRYIKRMQDWVKAGVAEHGSLHKLSDHFAVMLQRYDEGGLASAMLARWQNGQMSQGLKDEVLRRIGLLKGFSRDPLKAQVAAYCWLCLDDEDFERVLGALGKSATAKPEGGIQSAMDSLESATAPELRQVAIAAVNRLEALTHEKPPVTIPTPMGWTEAGYQRLLTLTDLTAQRFGISLPAPDPLTLADLAERVWVPDLGEPYTPENCLGMCELLALVAGKIAPRTSTTEDLPPLSARLREQMEALGLPDAAALSMSVNLPRDRVRRILAFGGWNDANGSTYGEALILARWLGCEPEQIADLAWRSLDDFLPPASPAEVRELYGANGLTG